MRDLNYQLKMLCRHSHEGSFETRVGRERQLTAIANQLHELGFRQLQATSLKQKHIRALVDHWQRQNLTPGTIKNRMSCLRWHDLKHTFGRRLRAAGVHLETRKILLSHKNGDITTHYSAPELEELIEAANRVCEGKSGKTPALVVLRHRTQAGGPR